MTMSFPTIGPEGVSDLIYALLSMWIRAHELAFSLIDFLVIAILGEGWV